MSRETIKALYDIGEMPPLGGVPRLMHAWTIRADRHGPPHRAFQREVVPVWTIGDDEVLVYVMAAGLNYNGVWAAAGMPQSVLGIHGHPFHVAGSDASGIVWAVGRNVRRWAVGDHVVVHCNQVDGDDEECNGGDPMLSPSQRIWGFETPDGSFSQYARVHRNQLLPKPAGLGWSEAGCDKLTFDARYVWMHQKRIQGSHFAHMKQAAEANRLVERGKVEPCLSRTFAWDALPDAHELMAQNRLPPGNAAILVGAPA